MGQNRYKKPVVPRYTIKLWSEKPPKRDLPEDLSVMFKMVKPLVDTRVKEITRYIAQLYKLPRIGNVYLSTDMSSGHHIVEAFGPLPADLHVDLIHVFERYDDYKFEIGEYLSPEITKITLMDTYIYMKYQHDYNTLVPLNITNLKIGWNNVKVNLQDSNRPIIHLTREHVEEYITTYLAMLGLIIFPRHLDDKEYLYRQVVNPELVGREYKYFIGSEDLDVFTDECPNFRDVILPLVVGYTINGISLDENFSIFDARERGLIIRSVRRMALHFVLGVLNKVGTPNRMFSLVTDVPPDNYSHILYPEIYTDWALNMLKEKDTD